MRVVGQRKGALNNYNTVFEISRTPLTHETQKTLNRFKAILLKNLIHNFETLNETTLAKSKYKKK